MKWKHFIKEYASRLALLCAALALFLFIPASLSKGKNPAVFGLSVTGMVLLILGGGVLLIIAGRYRGNTVHYFLYDYRRKKKRPHDALNADNVQDAIDFYLRPYVSDSPLSLFTDIPKPLRLQLEAEPWFRPLIMYRMLLALSDCTAEEIMTVFGESDIRAVTYLCRTLSSCGDTKTADTVYHLRQNVAREAERVAPFFKGSREAFATRSVRYIEQNFDRFYVEKSRFA